MLGCRSSAELHALQGWITGVPFTGQEVTITAIIVTDPQDTQQQLASVRDLGLFLSIQTALFRYLA